MNETFLQDFLIPLGSMAIASPLKLAGLLYAMVMLTTLLHEAGHALTARALGTPIIFFGVGRPCLLSFTLGQTRFMIGPIPGGQVTYAYADNAARWKVTAATLGGPLTELAGAFVVYLLAGERLETWVYLITVALNTLFNLNPLSRQTDGYKILNHLLALRQGRRTLDA